MKLNEQQQSIVEAPDGPMLVLAGAGTGKTRVLTHRIAHLLKEGRYNQDEIIAITFTNKAAKEMRDRVESMVEESPWITTFHSMAANIIKNEGHVLGYSGSFTILDQQDSIGAIKSILKELDRKDENPKVVAAYIDKLKNNGVYLGSNREIEDEEYLDIFEIYEHELRKNNAIDFGGLITYLLEIFEKHPEVLKKYQDRFKSILVDEYQDTNLSQSLIVNLLAKEHNNLFCVGDLDQGIYSFRNASIDNILEFEQIYPQYTLYKLEENYRSHRAILEVANSIIENNIFRKAKSLFPTLNKKGNVVIAHYNNQYDEANSIGAQVEELIKRGVDRKEIALMYRNNAQSHYLEEALRKRNISYNLIGGMKFYERKEIKDMLSYLRIINNANDDYSFLRSIKFPKRGIGNTTLAKLKTMKGEESYMSSILTGLSTKIKLSKKATEAFIKYKNLIAKAKEKINDFPLIIDLILDETGLKTYYEEGTFEDKGRLQNILELKSVLYDYYKKNKTLSEFLIDVSLILNQEEEKEERVTLMTVHASKGLEFKYIFLIGLEEDIFPSYYSKQVPEKIGVEEERRLFYVAITRAKEFISISNVKERNQWGNRAVMRKSRFLDEIPRGSVVYKDFSRHRFY